MLRWLTECNGRTTIAIRGGRTQWLTAALRRRVDLMKNDLQDRCHGVHHHFWFPLKIASTPTHINCSSDNDERPRRWISDKTRHTVARPAVLLVHFTHTLTVIHGGTKQRAICSPCPTSSNSTTIGRIMNVKIVFATIQLQHRCNINFIVRTKVVIWTKQRPAENSEKTPSISLHIPNHGATTPRPELASRPGLAALDPNFSYYTTASSLQPSFSQIPETHISQCSNCPIVGYVIMLSITWCWPQDRTSVPIQNNTTSQADARIADRTASQHRGGRTSSVNDHFGIWGGPLRYDHFGAYRCTTSVHWTDIICTVSVHPLRYIL